MIKHFDNNDTRTQENGFHTLKWLGTYRIFKNIWIPFAMLFWFKYC